MANGTAISFDGNDLQTASVLTSDIDHSGGPTKNVNISQLSHANRSVITNINYPDKRISISGTLVGTSITDLDAKIDAFNEYFRAQEANLDIGYNSGTRRYIATAVPQPDIKRPGGLTSVAFTVNFICTYPFGRDTSTTAALNVTGRTSSNYTDGLTITQNGPYQQPTFTITLTAVSSTGTQTMTVGNSGIGQALTISRSTWAAADVIVVNCSTKVVTVNGSVVDYTGAFPYFSKLYPNITYADTFTSRTFSENVTYLGLWY